MATAHETRLATLSAEASGFLVGPTVFKTDVGAQAPRRVRFPSASATVDPYVAMRSDPRCLGTVDDMSAIARLQTIAERAEISFDELLDFLDSPSGRRIRNAFAAGLIVSVPMIMRIPGLRRSPIGRLVELTGGTAIVLALAEAIREWERSDKAKRRARVIDVPPASP